MAKDYLCPMCKGQLRIKSSIVLSIKSKTNKKGLVFLNSEIGDYSKTVHPSFEIEDGEEYTFFCPICHATLNKEGGKHLAEIHMIDEDKVEYDVYISVIAGEQCTYKVRGKKAEVFGPDAKKYVQYFDVPEEYKKYLE